MSTLFLILAAVLFVAGGLLLYRRELLGPVAAFLAFASVYASGALAVNLNMLITWLCLTLVVSGVTAMQPQAVMQQNRGMGYMSLGALAGMSVGLLGCTADISAGAVYAFMVLGVVAGVFFGYLLFTRTPDGSELRLTRSRFFSYLLAKGFPLAIAVMMLGVVLILWIITATAPASLI